MTEQKRVLFDAAAIRRIVAAMRREQQPKIGPQRRRHIPVRG